MQVAVDRSDAPATTDASRLGADAGKVVKARLAVSAILAGVWLIPALREATEASMPAHMLLQFPLLLACGWLLATGIAPCVAGSAMAGAWRRLDQAGLTAMATTSCVAAFWMIPVALDLALLDGRINLAKYLSWVVTGAMLGAAWPRISSGLKLFFLGNVAWMLATAGLLFEEAEMRLCANYLIDEQRWTGWGLIAAACLVGAVAIHAWRTPYRRAVHFG